MGAFGIGGCEWKLFCCWLNILTCTSELSAGVERWGGLLRRDQTAVLTLACVVQADEVVQTVEFDVNNNRGTPPWLHVRNNTTQPEALRKHLQSRLIHFRFKMYRLSQRRLCGQEYVCVRWRTWQAAQLKLNWKQWALSEANRLVPRAFKLKKEGTPGTSGSC